MTATPERTGPDGYDDIVGRLKVPKGERAAVVRYLEAAEVVRFRQAVDGVGEAGGRELLQGTVVVLVTDRKMVAARTSGGFRPQWEVFTLPYGHLEPGVAVAGPDGTGVTVPTSGRRSYFVQVADGPSASGLAAALRDALRDYRRERMGLEDE